MLCEGDIALFSGYNITVVISHAVCCNGDYDLIYEVITSSGRHKNMCSSRLKAVGEI